MFSIRKLYVFLGNHNCKIVCIRCLSSYTSQNVLIVHKQKCIQQEKTGIRTSIESHLYWKNHFHKNPLYFRLHADFEADNEIDNSSIGNKTTNIYQQNPVCNSYYIVSESDIVLKSGFYELPVGYDKVDWFVDEIIKLENKMAFYLKNTNKEIIVSEKAEGHFRSNNICRFCEKEFFSDKVIENCHFTGKCRRPEHNKCNFIVTQKQSTYTICISYF